MIANYTLEQIAQELQHRADYYSTNSRCPFCQGTGNRVVRSACNINTVEFCGECGGSGISPDSEKIREAATLLLSEINT